MVGPAVPDDSPQNHPEQPDLWNRLKNLLKTALFCGNPVRLVVTTPDHIEGDRHGCKTCCTKTCP
jgi:hypothetical protein